MGHEVHVFDVIGRPISGIASYDTPGIKGEYETFQSKVSSIHLVSSMVHGNFRYIMAAPKLMMLARSVRADIILSLYAGGYATMAYLSGFRPYAVYAVGSDILMVNGYRRLISRLVLKSASQVFANGEYLTSRTKDLIPGAKTMSLLIGTDLTMIPLAEHRSETVQMICTREFKDLYNNEAIITAISRFPLDCPDFKMIFVSAGELLEQAISLADSILSPELRERVIFWKGVPYDRLLNGLRNSQIYISMSRSDGTAASLLEAMGAGLFPILSDIPPNRPWIDPERQNGMLVRLDDIEALSKTMLETIKKTSFLSKHAEYNRSLVREKADSAENRKTLEKRLKEIVYEKR
jgi:glycosyltransferase involved in cell wall biosynthesis